MCLGQDDNADLKTVLRDKGLNALEDAIRKARKKNQKDMILKLHVNHQMYQ